MLKGKEIGEIALMLWYLPLHKVDEIGQLVLKLKQECGYKEPIDDSDEWTREDMEDAARASMLYAEQAVPWNPPDDQEATVEPPPAMLPTTPTEAVEGGKHS